ncbi:MAG: hypothetical protein LUH19_04460 [Lachnospiraceae bacterium]|nr:hypothetical protein [Lachnospiraceae bacterium]
MSEKVVDHLAAGYEKVKKGVRAVMGGQILEYEAKTILRQGQSQGLSQGLNQGLIQGRMENLVQNIQALMETMNWTAEQAMDGLKVPKEKRGEIYEKL